MFAALYELNIFLKKRLASCGFALEGLLTIFREQVNFRIHCFAALIVIFIGLYLEINRMEWCILVIVISIVWVAEGINTALEYLCDRVTTETDFMIKKSKDIAAASVLISATAALIVGIIIFSKYV